MSDPNPTLDARIVDAIPRPTVAARVQAPWDGLDIGALFDHWLPEVARRVAELGGTIAGPPYARYHQFGPEGTDIEFGLPVAAPVAGLRPVTASMTGEVGASELPGGALAVAVHHGSYEGLAGSYDRLREWIGTQGRGLGPAPWESYVDDPSEVADPTQLSTEICWPLA